MTTEQWPEAVGLGPLYRRPTMPSDFMARRARRQAELGAMTKGGVIAELRKHMDAGRYAPGQAAGPVKTWSKDDVVNTVLWCEGLDPYDQGQLYRDGADVLGVDQEKEGPR